MTETAHPLDAMRALRVKHGFKPNKIAESDKAGRWSKSVMDKWHTGAEPAPHVINGHVLLPSRAATWPKNEPILDALVRKFEPLGFKWERKEWTEEVRGKNGSNTVTRRSITFENYPHVGGVMPTLADLILIPPELCDRWANTLESNAVKERPPEAKEADRRKMKGVITTLYRSGSGYAGFEGLSWRPTLEPFRLPAYFGEGLEKLGQALFLLCDAAVTLWNARDDSVRAVLGHKVPSRISRLCEGGSVRLLRPDIIIVRNDDGTVRPVVTEIESAPGGLGFLHALQRAYELPTTVVDGFVHMLRGRPLRIVMTHEWCEYLWDLATFCRALQERGVDACVYFDKPLEVVAARAAKWKMPQDTPVWMHSSWNPDFLGRCANYPGMIFGGDQLPTNFGSAVVFRFGYFDNFGSSVVLFQEWVRAGATLLNPLHFFLENKALMALVRNPAVIAYVNTAQPGTWDILRQCVAETRVLTPAEMPELKKDRGFWATKFGGWDGDNQSWGARSLGIGAQKSQVEWERGLDETSTLPHPVVAQHAIVSARYAEPWFNPGTGELEYATELRTRLTPFFLRSDDPTVPVHIGSDMTLRDDTYRVHLSTDAVNAPVEYTSN